MRHGNRNGKGGPLHPSLADKLFSEFGIITSELAWTEQPRSFNQGSTNEEIRLTKDEAIRLVRGRH